MSDETKGPLLERRKLFLVGEINDERIKDIIEDLIYFNDSKEEIFFYLCSDGGYIDSGLALLNVMNVVKYDINTIVVGSCSSMAAVIAACGTKGKRYGMSNSRIMFHESTETTEGKLSNVKRDIKETIRLEKYFNKILSKQIGKKLKIIEKDLFSSNFWFTTRRAITYGVIDRIWTSKMETDSNKIKKKTKEINGKKSKRRNR